MRSGTGLGGVYQIICVESGDRYFGSTVDFKMRQRAHMASIRLRNHYNHNVRAASIIYDSNSFEFHVLSVWHNMNMAALYEAADIETDLIGLFPKHKLLNVTLNNRQKKNYRHDLLDQVDFRNNRLKRKRANQ
jgi:GIY-YIG catalytic domain